MLAGAYAIGANSVQAQVGGQTIVSLTAADGNDFYAVTADGDSYHGQIKDGMVSWRFVGNVFAGSAASESQK